MAQGDTVVFHDTHPEAFKGNLGDMDADTVKAAFITASTTPAATDALPHFGGTGTTNLATNETSGGNVPAGGVTLSASSVNDEATGMSFGSGDVVIAANASNPTAARWMIVYNSTLASKRCAYYVDLGSAQNFVNGFTISAPSGGWFDVLNV